MKNDHVKGFEQVIIDYAKANNLTPSEMLSDCQTALLNVAGWLSECYQLTEQEFETFMMDYAATVKAAIDCMFGKE